MGFPKLKGLGVEMIQKKKSKINRYSVTTILFILLVYFYFIGMLIHSKAIESTVRTSMEKVTENDSKDPFDVIETFFSCCDAAFADNVYDKFTMIDINGLFQRILQRKIVNDVDSRHTVYQLDNGQLTYYYPGFGVNIAHKNIRVLSEYLDSVGTQLLYVQAPLKINKYDNQLPYGLTDYPNQNTDNFLKGLDKLEIDYVDFREVIQGTFSDYEALFYDTDHHWKTETGFWAYTYLMDYMKHNYGFSYDERNVNSDNFTSVTIKDSFIGSLANRVGTWYAGVDDFTFIYPNFDTSFTYDKYYPYGIVKDYTRVGSFTDTLFFKERMENGDKALAYRDNCYFNGNPALVNITNNNIPDGKLLVVQDSFGKSITPFLALNFHQIDVLDLRDYKGMTLLDYVKENHYDYVMIIYSPSCFSKGLYYQQFKFYDYK